MAETELERAEKRFAQAKARVQALRNREATKQRKLDTRRKVILGGALVDLAARDDAAAAMLDRLVRNLAREQDQAAFNGWDWRAERGGEDAEAGTRGNADQDEASAGDPAGMASGNIGDAQGAEPEPASTPHPKLGILTKGIPTHPSQFVASGQRTEP
jgi:hypothetical protein